MAHFLVINTGGTIGMIEGPKGLEPNAGEMERAFKETDDLNGFQTHHLTWLHWSPLLDSSNLQPEHWYRLRDDIQAYPDVDGVLIIHGTDTLAYSAAALSFLISSPNIPIIITGAMLPISDDQTDAIGNLNLALTGLCDDRREIMVAVGDSLLPASRTTKSTTLHMAAFTTPAWSDSLWTEAIGSSPIPANVKWQQPNVALITLYPGVQLSLWLTQLISGDIDAVLVNAYGNGNAANTEQMQQLLTTAKDQNVPVFVRSQCYEGDVNFGLYEASRLFTDAGAISCGSMPLEAALTKLQIICSQWSNAEDVKSHFMQPFAREWQSMAGEH